MVHLFFYCSKWNVMKFMGMAFQNELRVVRFLDESSLNQ